MSDVVSIKTPVQRHHMINQPCLEGNKMITEAEPTPGWRCGHLLKHPTTLVAVCLNKLILKIKIYLLWKRSFFEDLCQAAMHALPLTDHLSHHEEEADATGNDKLPSGQTSGVTVDLRHWSGHLAELLVLPQTDKAGHIFAPLWWRVWTFLLWCSQPKLREKCHNCQRFLIW